MELSKQIIRIFTSGSVDDGKSTLIGRLLYDTNSLFQDQINHVEELSKKRGFYGLDFSLLTDGLVDERSQGITIDVAYRYFSTPTAKYIIADNPGHVQYTRNMVSGSSDADVAIVLIDVNKGFNEQVIRHTFIACLFKTPLVVFCVNKMDSVNYNEEGYSKIEQSFLNIKGTLPDGSFHFIPISALKGDNVVSKSENIGWYDGPSLLELIEAGLSVKSSSASSTKRFSVQGVLREEAKSGIIRGVMGHMFSGSLAVGETVAISPGTQFSKVKQIIEVGSEVNHIEQGASAIIVLEDDIDVVRGSLIVGSDDLPMQTDTVTAYLCCFEDIPVKIKKRYLLRVHTAEYPCVITQVNYQYAKEFSEKNKFVDSLVMNDIANIELKFSKKISLDLFSQNKLTGRFILIDPISSSTVGCGIIV